MAVSKYKCDLKSCSLCQLCQKEWLPAIEANRSLISIKKGGLLFKEGDSVKGMFYINTGLVKVHKKWDDEKEMILRFAGKGAIVGHRGLGSEPIYPVSATALMDTKVCFIELDFFNATLKVNPDYLYSLLMFFAAELKESEKRMRNLTHMSAKKRIVSALLTLQQKFGTALDGSLAIKISRQDLASYTGTTYETLFKMMNELAAENLIKLADKKIIIPDSNKLHEIIEIR